jgi:diacylglycerol kinase (ATP)
VGLVDRPQPAVARLRAVYVVNARAGRRRTFDIAELIRRHSPFDHELIACGAKEDLDAIIEDAETRGVGVLFAVGGDGTVHETAKRLIGRQVALGIIPIGSGNGLARHLSIPMDPVAAIGCGSGGRIVAIDSATVNGLPFAGVMGLGFDAEIAHRFASSGVRGLQTYVREGLAALTGFRAQTYEIEAEGVSARPRALVVAVANSAQYGNDARIAPGASLTDGLLDVVIVEDASLASAPMRLARLFTGSFDRASGVTMFRATRLTIRREAEGHAHLDGEPVVLPAELEIAVHPASLRVLLPDGAGAL